MRAKKKAENIKRLDEVPKILQRLEFWYGFTPGVQAPPNLVFNDKLTNETILILLVSEHDHPIERSIPVLINLQEEKEKSIQTQKGTFENRSYNKPLKVINEKIRFGYLTIKYHYPYLGGEIVLDDIRLRLDEKRKLREKNRTARTNLKKVLKTKNRQI